MMKHRIILLAGLTFLLISCGGSKKMAQKKHRRSTPNVRITENLPENTQGLEDLPNPLNIPVPNFKSDVTKYIFRYKEIAMEEMGTFGIPASITLAQGILESNAGRSELTRKSNNHFGIKCHDWTGPRVYHDDDELQECFRKYDNPNYSFRDHSLFLKRSRYSDLFSLKIDDYKGWARGLKADGYATDPKYPQKLIQIIEQHDLYKYDQEEIRRLKKVQKKEIKHAEKTQTSYKNTSEKEKSTAFYRVRKGDTLYSISKRFGLSLQRLKELNHLKGDLINVGQRLRVK